MPAVFPGTIRSFSTKIDLEHTVFALHMNDVQDEISAIQTELGTLAKGSFANVRARLENIETNRSLTTHDHSNRLDIAAHDVTARHQFGAALGTPTTPTAITAGAVGAVGTGDVPARQDHVHAFDTAAITNAIIPAGAIMPYAGTAAPAGWALCDGAAVARGSTQADTYYRLFQAIGTAYGVGNGTTTFNLPDLRDRFPLGRATPAAAITTGGTKDAVVPVHSHGNDVHAHGQDNHQHGCTWAGDHEHTQENAGWMDGYPDIIAVRSKTGPFRAATTGDGWLHTFTRVEFLLNFAGNHTHTADWAGAGGIHNAGITIHNSGVSGTGQNMPPYQTVNFIIKL